MKGTTIKQWCKEHKAEIIGAGITVAAIAVTILVFKKHVPLSKMAKQLAFEKAMPVKDVAQATVSNDISCEAFKEVTVDMFIRNLPNGYHPSPEKIAQAIEMNITLGEHQTIVNPSIRKYAA